MTPPLDAVVDGDRRIEYVVPLRWGPEAGTSSPMTMSGTGRSNCTRWATGSPAAMWSGRRTSSRSRAGGFRGTLAGIRREHCSTGQAQGLSRHLRRATRRIPRRGRVRR